MTVRADDAIRVYINNQLLIDRWSGGVGSPSTVEFTSLAGTQNLVVEYREDLLNAYLEWKLERVLPVVPTPTPKRCGGSRGSCRDRRNRHCHRVPLECALTTDHRWHGVGEVGSRCRVSHCREKCGRHMVANSHQWVGRLGIRQFRHRE
ncbi:MAG UNVERIFIED_CONTAM: hypothetical protein LVT10_02870 [Anaerolineae bacterium]